MHLFKQKKKVFPKGNTEMQVGRKNTTKDIYIHTIVCIIAYYTDIYIYTHTIVFTI